MTTWCALTHQIHTCARMTEQAKSVAANAHPCIPHALLIFLSYNRHWSAPILHQRVSCSALVLLCLQPTLAWGCQHEWWNATRGCYKTKCRYGVQLQGKLWVCSVKRSVGSRAWEKREEHSVVLHACCVEKSS